MPPLHYRDLAFYQGELPPGCCPQSRRGSKNMKPFLIMACCGLVVLLVVIQQLKAIGL